MTAADASTEPVTVEVLSNEPKTEDLLIDTTVEAEDATQTADNTVTGASSATLTEPCSVKSQTTLSEKPDVEEKDDKEEDESEPEQRMPADIAAQRRMKQEDEINAATKEVIEPMKMLKKGATAVIGGTTVVVGLVMIPLPTPMGCVVASSGMAILGSEFEGAKEMNDRMIEKSKTTLGNARDKAIAKIESMNSNDDTDDDSVESEEEESPAWLKNMNEAERKRQRKLIKQKYKDENKSTNEQMKEYVTKRTSSFLSRSILPVLNKTKDWGKAEEVTAESAEGGPEDAEQNKVDSTNSPTASSATPSESLQKGKEKLSQSFQKGKEQVMPWFTSTSASLSNMVKQLSPQGVDEKTADFDDDEEIKFGKNTEAKEAAFRDDVAAPVTALATATATDAILAEAELGGPSLVAI
ncbi:MAG: hypothetical protein SGBAC_002511 [Bacillariaceae sp.]